MFQSMRVYVFALFIAMLATAAPDAQAVNAVTSGEILELSPSTTSIDRVDIYVPQSGTTIILDVLAHEQLGPDFFDLNGDSEFTVVETQLLVVDSTDMQIGLNSDGALGIDGSLDHYSAGISQDSYLTLPSLGIGTYSIFIGSEAFGLVEALAGVNDNLWFPDIGLDHADWQLTLSSSDPFTVLNVSTLGDPFTTNPSGVIPLPTTASLTIAVGLCMMTFMRRKRAGYQA